MAFIKLLLLLVGVGFFFTQKKTCWHTCICPGSRNFVQTDLLNRNWGNRVVEGSLWWYCFQMQTRGISTLVSVDDELKGFNVEHSTCKTAILFYRSSRNGVKLVITCFVLFSVWRVNVTFPCSPREACRRFLVVFLIQTSCLVIFFGWQWCQFQRLGTAFSMLLLLTKDPKCVWKPFTCSKIIIKLHYVAVPTFFCWIQELHCCIAKFFFFSPKHQALFLFMLGGFFLIAWVIPDSVCVLACTCIYSLKRPFQSTFEKPSHFSQPCCQKSSSTLEHCCLVRRTVNKNNFATMWLQPVEND